MKNCLLLSCLVVSAILFRRITSDDIAQRLSYVAEKEGFGLDSAAAQLIAVHADGGLRDALSILDQCAGMATGSITPQVVEELIGLVSKEWIIHFLDALRNGDGPKVLSYVHDALAEGRDATQIMEASFNMCVPCSLVRWLLMRMSSRYTMPLRMSF